MADIIKDILHTDVSNTVGTCRNNVLILTKVMTSEAGGLTSGEAILLEAAKLLEDVEARSTEVGSSSAGSMTSKDNVVMKSEDPWTITEAKDSVISWSDLSWRERLYRVFVQGLCKVVALIALLYVFVCSLDLLSSAFRLLGGRAAGSVFSNSELLRNPVAGLMIGVLATVLVQSSSTSTSITVTMVASGILPVRPAIPIIMGANIGTSVTNTIVSLAQSSNRDEFRRAFGGATVHDMFNWLTVLTLLPLEILTGYLYHLTSAIVNGMDLALAAERKGSTMNNDLLKTITKPLTDRIAQLDKQVIEGIALNDPNFLDRRLMKVWCAYESIAAERNVTESLNVTDEFGEFGLNSITNSQNVTLHYPLNKCKTLFSLLDIGDVASGALLLVLSLTVLCTCLVLLVRLLNSALRGSVMRLVRHVVNAGSESALSGYLAGYLAMLVGAGMTIIVQSSSVFTSALTPLVGVGVVKLERMYPLTLGSNVGTTTTGLLAALAADSSRLRPALQIALVHLFFNLSGILLFYPIPYTRLPIKLAKIMGNTTARYRWFAIFYVLLMFFLLPLLVFSLSLISPYLMLSVVLLAVAIFTPIIIINLLQRHRPRILPKLLRDWSFVPLPLRSLDPLDRRIMSLVRFLRRCSCCVCCRHLTNEEDVKNKDSDIKCQEDSTILASSTCSHGNDKKQNDYADDGEDEDNGLTSTVVRNLGCDSGYASRTTTPWNTPVNTPGGPTPCISRLPSCAVIHEDEDEECETSGNTVEHLTQNNEEIYQDGRYEETVCSRNIEENCKSGCTCESNSSSTNASSIIKTVSGDTANKYENDDCEVTSKHKNGSERTNCSSAKQSKILSAVPKSSNSSRTGSRSGCSSVISSRRNSAANHRVEFFINETQEPAAGGRGQNRRAVRRDEGHHQLLSLAAAALNGTKERAKWEVKARLQCKEDKSQSSERN